MRAIAIDQIEYSLESIDIKLNTGVGQGRHLERDVSIWLVRSRYGEMINLRSRYRR
jgi:hypothetical protein